MCFCLFKSQNYDFFTIPQLFSSFKRKAVHQKKYLLSQLKIPQPLKPDTKISFSSNSFYVSDKFKAVLSSLLEFLILIGSQTEIFLIKSQVRHVQGLQSQRVNQFIPSLSMYVRYRILSFSSQNESYPIGNLLSKHSPWESQRFCDFPQEITISFYQPMHIDTIKIAGHQTKIPSRVNILYHLPEHQDKGFVKYGYFTFEEGNINAPNPVEVKELANVDIKALEIRFILLRNHLNKNNFFNQVALSSLGFIATPIEHIIPSISMHNKSSVFNFDPQINIFHQLKSNFVKREQFQQAKQIKQVLSLIDRASLKMNQLGQEKQKCIKTEDYMGAKKVKEQMAHYKSEVTQLVNNFYDPQRKVLRTIKSDQKIRKKVEELNLLENSSTFSEGSQSKAFRSSRLNGQPEIMKQQMETVSEGEQEEQFQASIVSHEDKILPAVMSRIKGLNQTRIIPEASQIDNNQFFESDEKSPVVPAQPEAMSPADEANASILLQFYDSTFIKKIHSRYWQFRLQAIQKTVEELKQNQNSNFLNKNRLRCYLFIYSTSLKNHSYQITVASLELMSLLAAMKPQGQWKNELHNQLESALKNTLKKLTDSNQKVKSMAEKTILRIIQSSIFGVSLCYSSIVKSYHEKVTAKIRKIKLEDIQYMVEKYGVGQNGVPYSVADFALKAANDQDNDVRKSAVNLAKTVKQKGGKQRLDSLLLDSSGVKESIAKQLVH